MIITMLNGPPGAGKSTYIANHSSPGDKLVDIDVISRELPLGRRLAVKKAHLRMAALSPSPHTCWFCTAAPTRAQRTYWRNYVPINQTLLFILPLPLCVERAFQREGSYHLSPSIERWFRLYEPPDQEPNTLLITA